MIYKKLMQLSRNKTAIAISLGMLLVMAGLAITILLVRSQASNLVASPYPAASARTHTAAAAAVSGNPVRLQIPSLGMDLPVIPGYYNSHTQKWTLTTDKVQYATITPQPNNLVGNTFLYGHYRREVFARLHTIPSGASAVVTTDNGHTFYYLLDSEKVVSPSDSAAIFDYRGAPILTIQTCTGLLFQNRQLFIFKLVRVA